MISWIVASHLPEVFEANLSASLELGEDEELIVLNRPSITLAYAEGQERAKNPIRCYIHHDVQILDGQALRQGLLDWCRFMGMVGVVGSRDLRIPWWEGSMCGSVDDTRIGIFGPQVGGPCSILDGLLLATAHHIDWDTDWPGWHGYDHDACTQLLRRGEQNWCLTNGHELVRHNTSGPSSMAHLTGWPDAVARYQAKWGDSLAVG